MRRLRVKENQRFQSFCMLWSPIADFKTTNRRNNIGRIYLLAWPRSYQCQLQYLKNVFTSTSVYISEYVTWLSIRQNRWRYNHVPTINEIEHFQQTINPYHNKLNFTIEKDHKGRINFLEISITYTTGYMCTN